MVESGSLATAYGGVPPKAGKTIMYFVYILQSKKVNRYYIGYTNDLNKRLNDHNIGKVRSTKTYRSWNIIYTEEFQNKNEAYKREIQIKSYKGGEAFKRLLKKKIRKGG